MKMGVTASENVQATELQIHQIKAEDKRVQYLFLQTGHSYLCYSNSESTKVVMRG